MEKEVIERQERQEKINQHKAEKALELKEKAEIKKQVKRVMSAEISRQVNQFNRDRVSQ